MMKKDFGLGLKQLSKFVVNVVIQNRPKKERSKLVQTNPNVQTPQFLNTQLDILCRSHGTNSGG